METEKLTHRALIKGMLRESRKTVLDDKSASFSVTYGFITLILAYLGIRFISGSFISLLTDIFPQNTPDRYHAVNSVSLFFTFMSVILLAPLFTSFFSRGYALAKGKRVYSVRIPFYKSVYLFSGILIRFFITFVSFKLLLSYTQIADNFREYARADRDTVIAVSVLIFFLLSVISLYKFIRFFSVIFMFIKDPDTKCRTAVRTVKEHFKGHFSEFVLLNIKFLPILLATLLSMGVMLIYVIPHYTVSMALLCDTVLSDTKIKVKNYKFTYRLTEVNAK